MRKQKMVARQRKIKRPDLIGNQRARGLHRTKCYDPLCPVHTTPETNATYPVKQNKK